MLPGDRVGVSSDGWLVVIDSGFKTTGPRGTSCIKSSWLLPRDESTSCLLIMVSIVRIETRCITPVIEWRQAQSYGSSFLSGGCHFGFVRDTGSRLVPTSSRRRWGRHC